MANNYWGHPAWSAVPQAKSFTITSVGAAGVIWTFTWTDDDGDTQTVTFTNGGSPTIALAVTGLKNAWNAATHPALARITATESGGTTVILTADTAGIPFSVALTNNGAGADTETDTTVNVGNNDGSLDRNWSQNDAPDTGDDLIFEPGNVHWLYGLNFASVTLGAVNVFKGCQSNFGRFEFGKFNYLRVKPTALDYRGNGQLCLFDIGAEAIDPYIESYGSTGVVGRHVVYLKGSAMGTVRIAKGNVGIAPLDADTATVTTVLCGLLENPQSDIDLTLGPGVTLTTLTQSGGRCLMKCAGTTVNVYPNAILTTEGTGAIVTVNVYEGATFYPKSTGTITNLNVWGTVDFSRDTRAKTVTNLNLKRKGKVVKHDNITITTTTLPSSSGSALDTIQAA